MARKVSGSRTVQGAGVELAQGPSPDQSAQCPAEPLPLVLVNELLSSLILLYVGAAFRTFPSSSGLWLHELA